MNPLEHLIQEMLAENLWEKEIELSRNEFLNVQGKIDTNLYYVEEGSLRIFIWDEDEEHTIRFGYKNDFIAALDAFIKEQPSALYIQALKKTKLKVISKATYMEFLNASSERLQIWQSILGHLICDQLEREIDLLISSPQKRFQRVFKRSPRLFQEIPQKYIANYLRMTPETFSRLKKS